MAKKIVRSTNNVFVADLSKIKLSAEQQKAIADGIQEIVMLELAQIDNGAIVTAKPPKGWQTRGIVAMPVNTLPSIAVKDINAELENMNPFNG